MNKPELENIFMMVKNTFSRNLIVLFLAFVLFNISCTSKKDKNTYAEQAIEETLIPVRPGMGREQPFWNEKAVRFIQVPSFEFNEIKNADLYIFTAHSQTNGRTYTFKSKNPQDILSPIWQKLPAGKVKLIVEALDENGKVIAVSGTRQFYKAAPFNGPYQSPVINYRESAKIALRNLFQQSHIQNWLKTGKPDDAYELYCYASKLYSAVTAGMILYARMASEDSLNALTIARRAADYLIQISQPADAPLAYFPPTYRGNALSAAWFNGQIIMNSPTEAACAYLDLFDISGEKKYYSAALRIAETYLKLQLPSGTWKLKLSIKSGGPVDLNETIPIDIIKLFDRFIAQYNQKQFSDSRDNALEWIRTHSLKTFNWEGQYEDIILQRPYQNLTQHQAASYAIYILKKEYRNAENIRIAKELVRFAEDQFVIWESPLPDQSNSFNWLTPCVLEQYRFYEAVDASASKMIIAYQTLFDVTGDDLYLAKAISFANNMTTIQKRYHGRYTTWWRIQKEPNEEDWINCAVYDARVMLQFYNFIESMNHEQADLRQKNLLLLLSQPPADDVVSEMIRRYSISSNINEKIQILRYITQADMQAAYPLLLAGIKNSNDKLRAAAVALMGDVKFIAELEIFQKKIDDKSTLERYTIFSAYGIIADKYLDSGNWSEAREYFHQILKSDPDFFDARHSLIKLETIGTTESLLFIRPYLDNGGLSQFAATAYIKILLRHPEQLYEEDIIKLLQILTKSTDLETVNKIIDWIQHEKIQLSSIYQKLALQNGYLSQWWVAGPFSNDSQLSAKISNFPKNAIMLLKNNIYNKNELHWQFVQPLNIFGIVSFANMFGKRKDVVAYAYTEISLSKQRDVIFKIGSNDGVICWINKNLVHSNLNIGRPLKLDEDIFKVKLKKGTNTILLKVPNIGGNWETCVRINDLYDKPLDLTPYIDITLKEE